MNREEINSMSNIYYLENYIDIDTSGQASLRITYFKNDHPALEQEILDRDIAIRGCKLTSMLFDAEWYIYKLCNVVNIVEFTTQLDSFIIYTLIGKSVISVRDKGVVRKLNIDELFLEYDFIEDDKKLSENQIDNFNIDTLNINSKKL